MGSRITSKGQITIPAKIRERMGIEPGDEIIFVEENGRYYLSKAKKVSPFDKWVGYLSHLKGQSSDQLITELRGEFDD
jgi:AbrB family looped-hinge helix DNA binding protein